MSAQSRRATIVLLIAVSVVAGTVIAGGVVGQTETETATEAGTPTEAATGTPTTPETGTTNETTGPVALTQDSALLRVAHVSPDAPPVDVYVDGERVLADVPFGAVTDYGALLAGRHAIAITPAGDNETTVFEGNVTLEPRSVVTLFASGEVGEDAAEPFAPIVFADDAFTPAEDVSAVSVAHMSPDAPAVDVTVDNGSAVIADNLSFREASQYVSVAPGTYTVEVRTATETNDGSVIATAEVTVEGGTAYSAVAIGYANADESAGEEAFRVEVVEDATKTVVLPSAGNGSAAPGTATPAGGETATPGETTATDG